MDALALSHQYNANFLPSDLVPDGNAKGYLLGQLAELRHLYEFAWLWASIGVVDACTAPIDHVPAEVTTNAHAGEG